MKSSNWLGYVYEHIVIAEQDYGRPLLKTEEVHHLDLNRMNNSPANLVVLQRKSHRKLHYWIDRGCPINGLHKKRKTSQVDTKKNCKKCSKPIHFKNKFCSRECYDSGKETKLGNVSINEVLDKLKTRTMVSVSKDYGVSDNGLKRWILRKQELEAKLNKNSLH